jgi:hypothetical protein
LSDDVEKLEQDLSERCCCGESQDPGTIKTSISDIQIFLPFYLAFRQKIMKEKSGRNFTKNP